MALRQQYTGPRPRAIARHLDHPGRAAAPAHTGPPGISPPRQPGLGAQRSQQTSQPWLRNSSHSSIPGGPGRHEELPLGPEPGIACVYHGGLRGLRRWNPSGGVLLQVAGDWPVPVSVL
jgi:hypothetical protein